MEVTLQNLTKVFPSRNKKSGEEVIAVNDMSITIPDGKLVGLLGPSGCGKSTTLYMICGLQKATGGKIFFGKDDVTNLTPENRGVGLVFQNYALYPHLTVKQNILFPLQNLKGEDKLSKEERKHLEWEFEIRDKLDAWSGKYFGILPIDLDESRERITGDWSYEYAIFELVRLYKIFDWENDELVLVGW